MKIPVSLEEQLSSEIYEYIKVVNYRTYKLFGKDYYCDVCIVKDKNKHRDFIRLQKRWFGISKRMLNEGVKQPKWIVINSYNFTQKFEFRKTKKIFENIYTGKTADDSLTTLELDNSMAEEISKLKTEVEKMEKRKRKDKKTQVKINELQKKASFLDQENREIRKRLTKTQLPQFKQLVKDSFKSLETEGETYFQKLFTKNKWIFGPSYEEVIPKRQADTKNQPDFILKRYDGFSDVVEIESPAKILFTKPDKSGKSQPTSLLMQSVAQAMDYIESYNQAYKDLFYEDMQNNVANPIHAYYPQGLVIIGKDKNTDRKKLRQLNNFLHNITVLTYDEFLKQAERIIEMIEK